MGLFDKFKKKKEAANTAPAEAVKVNTENAGQDAAAAAPNQEFTISGYDSYTGKDTSIYEMWTIFQEESGRNDEYDLVELAKPAIEDAKSRVIDTKSEHPDAEVTILLREVKKHCDSVMNNLKKEKAAAKREPGKTVSHVNAELYVYMSKSKLRLWGMVLPPLNAGEAIDSKKLEFTLGTLSVKYGIDNKLLARLAAEKIYMKAVLLAEGKEAIHGKSGSCENMFLKHIDHANFKEDMHGNVNYKELNMIQSIHKGDVICKITLPTEAHDGMTVTGETIIGREGKFPYVPQGKNTVLTPDKTELVAAIDGEVLFENNKFVVRNLLTIESDVDNAVGNIDFTGDVLIKGGVREGYTVKAEGDVHIIGTVEGATIIVGGNLVMDRGMTGGNKGTVEVQGTLKCKYLENCKVYAKEGVEVDQLNYCKLSTDKNIIVKGKKGLVTGGRLVAGGTVEATVIGSPANNTLKTEIVLGVIPHLVELEKDLKRKVEASQSELLKMTQDINYINKNINTATQERKDMLKNLISQYQLDQLKNQKLEAELEEVSTKIQENTANCGLKCAKVYSIMSISVCGINYVLNKEITDCKVIRKGTKNYITGSNLTEMIIF